MVRTVSELTTSFTVPSRTSLPWCRHHDAARYVAHEIQVVFDQDGGETHFVRQFLEDGSDGHALGLGKTRSRLVEKNDAWFQSDDHRQFESLSLTMRQRDTGLSSISAMPVSVRISAAAAGSMISPSDRIGLGLSRLKRAILRHSPIVMLSKMLAT